MAEDDLHPDLIPPPFDPKKPYQTLAPQAAPAAPPFDPTKPYQPYQPPRRDTSILSAAGQGARQGLTDLLYGGAQLGARMGADEGGAAFANPAELQQRQQTVDVAQQQREHAYDINPAVAAHPLIAGMSRIGGNIASTAPLGAFGTGARLPSAAAMIGRGMLQGGAGAAVAPVTGGDYWDEKTRQIGLGMALGGALPGVGGVLAPRLPAPQILNRAFRPLWNFISGAEERTVDGFDRAIASQVLEPIGASIPRNAKGHALVDATESAITTAYDQVLPHLHLNPVSQADMFAHNPELAMSVSELGADEARQFDTIMSNRVFSKLGAGPVDGGVIKDMQRDLGKRGISFLGGNSSNLGQALLEARTTLNDLIAQQNPQFAPQLRRADEAWKLYSRMRAASGGATSIGRFTPADILRAIRRQDPTKGAFSKGDSLLQGYAEAGLKALGQPRSSAWELMKITTGKGAIAELVRDLIQPAGRGMKSAAPVVAGPLGLTSARAVNAGVPVRRPQQPSPFERPLNPGSPIRPRSSSEEYIEPPGRPLKPGLPGP